MIGVDKLAGHGFRLSGRILKSCHLVSTPDAIDDLHALAAKIGIKRQWFHDSGSVPHYDLVESKRKEAIAAGAAELTKQQAYDILMAWHRHRMQKGG